MRKICTRPKNFQIVVTICPVNYIVFINSKENMEVHFGCLLSQHNTSFPSLDYFMFLNIHVYILGHWSYPLPVSTVSLQYHRYPLIHLPPKLLSSIFNNILRPFSLTNLLLRIFTEA